MKLKSPPILGFLTILLCLAGAGVRPVFVRAQEVETPVPLIFQEGAAFVDWSGPAIGVSAEVEAPEVDAVRRATTRRSRETREEYDARIQDERRNLARDSAVALAKERALPALLSMRLDRERTIADLEIADPAATLLGAATRVEIVREVWHERPGGSRLAIDARIPIWDKEGQSIGSVLLRLIGVQLEDPPEKVLLMHHQRRRFRKGEMIVFDARGTALAPAIFPRVVTDDGKLVYNAAAVDRRLLLSQGLGAYMIMSDDAQISKGSARGALPLVRVLPVSAVPEDSPATCVVEAKAAAPFLEDPRRLAMLAAGRVRFVVSPPKAEQP